MSEISYSYDRTLHFRLKGCSNLHQDDIEKIISECILLANATECKTFVHYFEPHGLSSASILSESHINFHITPEEGQRYVQMDISTCGTKPNPIMTVEYMLSEFNPDRARISYEFLGFDSGNILFPDSLEEFLSQAITEKTKEKYEIVKSYAFPELSRFKDQYRMELKRK
ncbi:MAG: S-adenosylmethionine decarboxylase [Candidatus Woesearchaeota archaeon]|nr:S-adenosylmethionine decarboxylase [Candidatus Woesearchaeota archaeon]